MGIVAMPFTQEAPVLVDSEKRINRAKILSASIIAIPSFVASDKSGEWTIKPDYTRSADDITLEKGPSEVFNVDTFSIASQRIRHVSVQIL